MIKPDLTAGRTLPCDLVPQGVVDGDASRLSGFDGEHKHHEYDDDRNPEAPSVGLLFAVVHRVQYSA